VVESVADVLFSQNAEAGAVCRHPAARAAAGVGVCGAARGPDWAALGRPVRAGLQIVAAGAGVARVMHDLVARATAGVGVCGAARGPVRAGLQIVAAGAGVARVLQQDGTAVLRPCGGLRSRVHHPEDVLPAVRKH